jgi:hypothetical protein
MSESCGFIRELLEDGLSRELTAEEHRTVDLHVTDCTGCRRYRDGLRSDDRRLGALAASVDGLASRIEDGVLGASSSTGKPDGIVAPRWFQHPATRVAAAIAVIVAIALVSHLSRRTVPTDVIWANVFRQIEQSAGCIARGVIFEDGEQYDFIVYESSEFGIKQEISLRGRQFHRSYIEYGPNTVTLVNYNDSTYFHHSFWERTMDIFRRKSVSNIVSRMKALPHKDLGISEIDGIASYGIEVVDTTAYSGKRRIDNTRLFIHIETQWPVRIEGKSEFITGESGFSFALEDFDWDPVFKRADFEAVIPKGFRPTRSVPDSGG